MHQPVMQAVNDLAAVLKLSDRAKVHQLLAYLQQVQGPVSVDEEARSKQQTTTKYTTGSSGLGVIRKHFKMPVIPQHCSQSGQYDQVQWELLYRNVKGWAHYMAPEYAQALDVVYHSPDDIIFPLFAEFLGEETLEADEALGVYLYNELPNTVKRTIIKSSDYEVKGVASGVKIMHFLGSRIFKRSPEVLYKLMQQLTTVEPAARPSDIESKVDKVISIADQIERQGEPVPAAMYQMAIQKTLSTVFNQWPVELNHELITPVKNHMKTKSDVSELVQTIRDGCFSLRQDEATKKLMDKHTPTTKPETVAGATTKRL